MTRTLVTGLVLAGLGVVILSGLVPGSDDWSRASRLGIGMVLLTFGLLLLGIPLVTAFLLRTTRPEDYKGGCPVGVSCACGHFNFKPRKSCSRCGSAVSYP